MLGVGLSLNLGGAAIAGDTTPPQVVSVEIGPDGIRVFITFDKPVTGNSLFSMTKDEITGYNLVFDFTSLTTLEFICDQVFAGETGFQWSYVPGDVVDLNNNPLAEIGSQPVINNSTVEL